MDRRFFAEIAACFGLVPSDDVTLDYDDKNPDNRLTGAGSQGACFLWLTKQELQEQGYERREGWLGPQLRCAGGRQRRRGDDRGVARPRPRPAGLAGREERPLRRHLGHFRRRHLDPRQPSHRRPGRTGLARRGHPLHQDGDPRPGGRCTHRGLRGERPQDGRIPRPADPCALRGAAGVCRLLPRGRGRQERLPLDGPVALRRP
ncbi:hypothetical protein D3C85_732580 [compost metagenome]